MIVRDQVPRPHGTSFAFLMRAVLVRAAFMILLLTTLLTTIVVTTVLQRRYGRM